MVFDCKDVMSVHHKVSDVMITNQNLERFWFLDIINVSSKVQWAAVRMWRLVMIEPPQ